MQEHLMGRALALVLLVATSGACGRSTSDGDAASAASATDSSAFVKKVAGPATDSLETLASVRDVTITGECPDPGASAAADIAAQAAATIPLKVGLTLSHMWKAYEGDYEHECLEQVRAIDARSVLTTGSCPTGKERVMSHWTRRLCRTDLTDSYIYLTSSHAKYPETFRGALKFSMSSASFATLKRDGKVRHRYLDIASRTDSLLVLDRDVDGVLETQDKGTFKLVVNDTAVDVPVIEAMHQNGRKGELIRVKVLDDARFPLMLDYYHPASHFFITYTKVTYPTEHEIEKQLAKDKHVDVYGIYFDFASDSLRPESAPILHEIATALAGHPEWKVTITGHTDSIGGSASNLDLSRRRSARVRRALVEQYRTDSLRISTSGSGDSQPKDVNTTPEGRARNRRVELVRD